MPLTYDFSDLNAGVARLLAAIEDGVMEGLGAGAELVEAADKATTAYVGMSGATRDSTVAFVLGPGEDGAAQREESYAAAAAALAGFTGHRGKPAQIEVISIGPDERAIELSNSTNYAETLEVANAGEKAHIGESMLSNATAVTALVAAKVKAHIS